MESPDALLIFAADYAAGIAASYLLRALRPHQQTKGKNTMNDNNAAPLEPVTLTDEDMKYVLAASMILMDMVERLPGFDQVRLGIVARDARTDIDALDPEEIMANSVSVLDLAEKLARICQAESVRDPRGNERILRPN